MVLLFYLNTVMQLGGGMPGKRSNLPDVDMSALESLAETQIGTKSERDKAKKKDATDSPLTVKIPAYVHTALKVQSATIGKTQRQIILEALKEWGIDVKQEDIVDRRGKS